MKALLTAPRYRRFRRVWGGQLVNIVGDAVFAVTAPLFLLPRTDAAAAIGTVLAASALGGVVSLFFAGALADRHRRSQLIVVADLVRAVGLGVMLLVGPGASQCALAGCAAVVGIGSGLYRPAYMALLPSLVPEQAMPAVNALRTLTGRLSMIVGGLIAGGLSMWLAPRTILLIDLLSFSVRVFTLFALREPAPHGRDRPTLTTDVAAGFAYVAHRRWMLAVMVQGTVQVAVVVGALSICLPLLLGRHGVWYGMAVAAEAVGAIVGASIAASHKPARPGMVGMLALLCQTPQLVAIAAHAHAAVIVMLSGGAGFGMSIFAVLWTSALQSRVAANQLGRVFAVDQLTATALAPIGLSIAGWTVAVVGTSPTAWAAAAVLVSSVVATLPISGVVSFADPAGRP
jgi:predicted hotdog family 3-hydroxylacyl-ACP dehydratase